MAVTNDNTRSVCCADLQIEREELCGWLRLLGDAKYEAAHQTRAFLSIYEALVAIIQRSINSMSSRMKPLSHLLVKLELKTESDIVRPVLGPLN